MVSNNKQVEYDIQQFLKNPKKKEEIKQQNIYEKYFLKIYIQNNIAIK